VRPALPLAVLAGAAALAAAAPAGALEPAPQLVATPDARSVVRTPTYRWTGAGAIFDWSLTRAGEQAPLHSGTIDTTADPTIDPATASQITLPSLGDGDYVFRVAQRTSDPLDIAGTPAEHAFSLDATPPAAVRVVGAPPFPTTTAAPSFTIADVEAGATATWQVVAAGGALVQGPAPAPAATIGLSPLSPGSYVFVVGQTDAFGNAGPPTSVPFAIVAPAVAKPAPSTSSATTTFTRRIMLPKLRPNRLRPKVGHTIRTRKPILRWARGPRNATAYNVQVFRVGNATANQRTVRLIKFRSLFPRGRKVRVKGLAAGRCYVWRVWPYIGRSFTRSPLGVSNFCVAKSAGRRARTAAAARRAVGGT
jgi:hypothetical protein